MTTSDGPGQRHLGGFVDDKPYPAVVDRWAVIVGISKYRHAVRDLRFADRDARALAELLAKPSGGGFEPDKVRLLIDEEATTANLTRALRSFLKRPDAEDIVLLYFACHGAPDPDRPENLYLITHDADPADIAGTAVPMREIDLALRETLRAERVVLLAVTCHSGGLGLGAGRRAAVDEAALVNRYLEELSGAKGGLALLTSAAANKTSKEREFGADGGHGVFTYYLLRGLKGAADGFGARRRDGRVGLGELFEYVRERVKETTGGRQHPVIGATSFDRDLPVAITGQVNAAEHLEIGRGLFEVARRLDEPLRYRAAAAHFDEVAALAGMAGGDTTAAELGSARCLVAGGYADEAVRALDRLNERDPAKVPAEAHFWLGIAHAGRREYAVAANAFAAFLETAPDHRDAAWVGRYVGWLEGAREVRRHALLIGVDDYLDRAFTPLQGCVSDKRLLRDMLVRRFGFAETDVVLLHDAAATRTGMLAALDALARRTGPADQGWVYYGGHSVLETQREKLGAGVPDDLYLCVHDTGWRDGRLTAGVSAQELHSAMLALPAGERVLVLDIHPSERFNRLAEDAGAYTVLLATDSAEVAYEVPIEIDGRRRMAGLFTAALYARLAAEEADVMTFGGLMDATIGYIHERGFDQTPLLIGDRDRPVFAREDHFLRAFRFAERRSDDPATPEVLLRRYRRLCDRLAVPFPSLHLAYGRTFLDKKSFGAALLALDAALEQRGGDRSEARRLLIAAHLGARDHAEALRACQAAGPGLAEVARMIGRLRTGVRRGLLVGIRHYLDREAPEAAGADDDARLMEKAIVERCGFRTDDVVLLIDSEATRERLLAEFGALAESGRDEPALFFFAGYGSSDAAGAPTIVPADGRPAEQPIFRSLNSRGARRARQSWSVSLMPAGCNTARRYPISPAGPSPGRSATGTAGHPHIPSRGAVSTRPA